MPCMRKFTSRGFPGGLVIKNLLPVRETRVQSLLQEDSTRHGAAKPLRPNNWVCLCSEPGLLNEKPLQQGACTLQLGSSPHPPQLARSPPSNEDPAQPKTNTFLSWAKRWWGVNPLPDARTRPCWRACRNWQPAWRWPSPGLFPGPLCSPPRHNLLRAAPFQNSNKIHYAELTLSGFPSFRWPLLFSTPSSILWLHHLRKSKGLGISR